MISLSRLVDAWNIRSVSSAADTLQFSPTSRREVAEMLMKAVAAKPTDWASSSTNAGQGGGQSAGQGNGSAQATRLAHLASSHGLNGAGLTAELRSFQVSLIEQQLQHGSDVDSQAATSGKSSADSRDSLGDSTTDLDENSTEPASGDSLPDTDLQGMLGRIDTLICASVIELARAASLAVGNPDVGKPAVVKKKSLQHEIRTPLQGALLTAELVLEDIGQGDTVSLDDIQSIRKSIETAVRILNEFSGKYQ